MFSVRGATALDEPFLREMLYVALFVPLGHPALPRSILREPQVARYVDRWGAPGDRGLIALVDGVEVGAAWVRYFTAREPGYGFVDESTPELSTAVLSAHRGKGIGSQLIQLLIAGIPSISLSCDPANPAWRLYLRLGFEPLPAGRTLLRNAAV